MRAPLGEGVLHAAEFCKGLVGGLHPISECSHEALAPGTHQSPGDQALADTLEQEIFEGRLEC